VNVYFMNVHLASSVLSMSGQTFDMLNDTPHHSKQGSV
jgi:hypothetical protein